MSAQGAFLPNLGSRPINNPSFLELGLAWVGAFFANLGSHKVGFITLARCRIRSSLQTLHGSIRELQAQAHPGTLHLRVCPRAIGQSVSTITRCVKQQQRRAGPELCPTGFDDPTAVSQSVSRHK